MQMETYTTVSGRMAKHMEQVYSLIRKERCMMGNGKTTSIMVRVKRNGITTRPPTMVTSNTVKKQAKAGSFTKAIHMREISKMACSMEKENISSLILEKLTKVISNKISFKELVLCSGQTTLTIQETLKMECHMARVLRFTLMASHTRAHGKTA